MDEEATVELVAREEVAWERTWEESESEESDEEDFDVGVDRSDDDEDEEGEGDEMEEADAENGGAEAGAGEDGVCLMGESRPVEGFRASFCLFERFFDEK